MRHADIKSSFLDYKDIPKYRELNCTETVARLLHTRMKSPRDFFPNDVFNATCLAYNYSSSEQSTQRYIGTNSNHLLNILMPINQSPGLVLQLPSYWPSIFGILILCYDKNTRITHAVLSSQDGNIGSSIIKSMKKQKRDWSNPVLIALEFYFVAIDFLYNEVKSVHWKLGEVNHGTGHFNYAIYDNDTPVKIDFFSTSRILNMSGQDAATLTAHFTSLLQGSEQLRIFKESTENTREESTSQDRKAAIEEKLNILTEVCRSYVLEAQALEKRSNVLLQVVS